METRKKLLEKKMKLEKREKEQKQEGEKKRSKNPFKKIQNKVRFNFDFDFTREEVEYIERQFFERNY